jgi:hypothetical protein
MMHADTDSRASIPATSRGRLHTLFGRVLRLRNSMGGYSGQWSGDREARVRMTIVNDNPCHAIALIAAARMLNTKRYCPRDTQPAIDRRSAKPLFAGSIPARLGELGMFGHPISSARWRAINAAGAAIVLLAGIVPLAALRCAWHSRSSACSVASATFPRQHPLSIFGRARDIAERHEYLLRRTLALQTAGGSARRQRAE